MVDIGSFILFTVRKCIGVRNCINNELVHGFHYKDGEFAQILLSADACKNFEVNHRVSV